MVGFASLKYNASLQRSLKLESKKYGVIMHFVQPMDTDTLFPIMLLITYQGRKGTPPIDTASSILS